MRQINGTYAQRFNRVYGYDGQLFRGHYKPKKFMGEDEGDIISLIFQKKKLPSILNLIPNM